MATGKASAKMTQSAAMANRLYDQISAFTDVFDEETFYLFAICVAVGTIFMAFILSRFVTIKSVD